VVAKILVYFPSNQRTIQLETTILALHRDGLEVELLTTCDRGPLHAFLERKGVRAFAHPLSPRPSWVYYSQQIGYLVRFCRARGTTTVLANLQPVNLIAVLAQYLIPARVVVFRHHFKFVFPGDGIGLERNRMEQTFDKVINRLAATIVVPSWGVYNGMRETENADMDRVVVLPYIYDFNEYPRPDPRAVGAIRARYPARLTLLVCGRLIPFKRPALVLTVVRELIEEGLDLRLFVLGEGTERERLENFVRLHALEDRIIMLGFRPDVMNYMAASDLLIHPSLTEASSSTVKEMALAGGTVIACEGVGDFDEYLRNGHNAFLVPRTTDGAEIAQIIRGAYCSPDDLKPLAAALRAAVLDRFGVTPAAVDRYVAIVEGAQ
jgi:glycosyltransferase involved in cell wall biosynthesis